jgi:predicted small integral membrane protein
MEWMAWTTPVAIFFSTIAVLILAMTVWQVVSPSTARKGWLPIKTTRGDRFFLGLLSSAFACLAIIGIDELWLGRLIFNSDHFGAVALPLSAGLIVLFIGVG